MRIGVRDSAGLSTWWTLRSQERNAQTLFSINNKMPSYHEAQFLATASETPSGNPFFDLPTCYPPAAGFSQSCMALRWYIAPMVNEDLQTGSIWGSGDDYCMRMPALAIDLIPTSGPDLTWLVRRKSGALLALTRGLQRSRRDTVEEASRRELVEEMAIELSDQPLNLFGVYSDPKRDSRKRAVSVDFQMDITSHQSYSWRGC